MRDRPTADVPARARDEAPDHLAATSSPTDSPEASCRMFEWAVELLWRHELPMLAAAPAFAAAQTIVDLGAGSGAFGRRLAASYPEKRFLGVEPDETTYALGARSAFPSNYRYVHGGYESVTETHDLLFARHVLPFVPDRDALYAWARRRARAAIIVSWGSPAMTVQPALALFAAAIGGVVEHCVDEHSLVILGDHALTSSLAAELVAAGLQPSAYATLHADESGWDGRRIFHHVARDMIAAVARDAMSRPRLDELYDWSLNPVARLGLSLHYQCVLNPSLAIEDPVRPVAA